MDSFCLTAKPTSLVEPEAFGEGPIDVRDGLYYSEGARIRSAEGSIQCSSGNWITCKACK